MKESNGAWGGRRGPIAVVLPGGGARGAYEAGALSVLLPALESRGERVEIFCGTSVGAINAGVLAASAHLPAAEQAATVLDAWRELRPEHVLAPLIGPRGSLRALRLAGEALGVPGVRAGSLLDASPLRATVERLIDFRSLHANVRSGAVSAVCVVATALADGMPVGFLEQRGRDVPRASEDVRYARSALETRHVLASSAIPLLFPPVHVRSPSTAAGFYLDGATRLNAPLRPAIELGAGRVLVVGFEPPRLAAGRRPANGAAPHMADVAANVVDGLLVDQVNQDMRRLAAINTFFVDGSFGADAARAYRESRGRRPYRKISYAFVTPRRGRQLGALADRAFARRGSWRRPRQGVEDLLVGRLLRSADGGRGELLSLLMFDREHAEALIEAGRADAGHWLNRHPDVWCADSAHDFDIDPKLAVKVQQEVSLAEWRALKRR